MAEPLRLALVSFYPADVTRISGGIRAVAYLLVEGLRRYAELDIHVIHCHSDVTRDRTTRAGNVTAHYLALPRRRIVPNMVSGMGRVARLLREISPDVVNTHGYNYAVATLRAGYLPVWTIHGILAQEAQYNPGPFNKLAFALGSRYERQALAQVREITAISPYIQKAFQHRTAARWHLIENPAPDDLFALERRPVAGRLLLPASVIPRKDPLTLVQALALARQELPHLHLQIAGRTNETAYVREVQATCQALGVADQVAFLGVQSQPEMRMRYSQAQLVVLSSREEVSPMAAIEGLAAGIPVVTTAAGGAGYIVDDGQTGRVVAVGDAPGLARAICQVLGSEEAYREMSQNARSTAERRFRQDRVAASYLAVYRLAAAEARRGGGS